MAKTHYSFEERIAGLQAQAKRFYDPPGDELTRACALGTWYSFFGDYRGYDKLVGMTPFQIGVLREHYASVHVAAVDHLIRLGATIGIDATPLKSAGAACRLIAKQGGLLDPDALSCNWPDCLGKHLYELPTGQQTTIEAGEQVVEKLRLKLGAVAPPPAPDPDGPEDPIEVALESQALALYRVLRPRRHWVAYGTLADEDCDWRNCPPEDKTVRLALKKLQSALSNMGPHAPSLKIDHVHRRAKLIPPGT